MTNVIARGQVLGVPVSTRQAEGRYLVIVSPDAECGCDDLLRRLMAAGGELEYDAEIDRLIVETIDALAAIREHCPKPAQLRMAV